MNQNNAFVGKKIMVVAPARDHDWMNEAVITYATIVASIPHGNFPILKINSDVTHISRNLLFDIARKLDVDYFISMDSDTVLLSHTMSEPIPIVPYLVSQSIKYQADFISGISVIPLKDGKLISNAFSETPAGLVSQERLPTEMAQVDAVGGGLFFLTKKLIRAFDGKRHPRPFDWNWIKDLSEDLSFCLRVRELGFKIWVDPAIKLGHKKAVLWTVDFIE